MNKSKKIVKEKSIPQEIIQDMIYVISGQKVMLDFDLASLYGVETKQLKRAVKRHHNRFPEDFIFQLTREEYQILRCQFGTSRLESKDNLISQFATSNSRCQFGTLKTGNLKSQFVTSSWGGRRKMPLAFTEQGVAMLSSVLNSDRAIQVNIAIMRTFTQLRKMMVSHTELRKKVEKMEKKYNENFKVVFIALRKLLEPPKTQKGKIGFHN